MVLSLRGDMDPELSDADMEAINKLIDKIEKSNKQWKMMEESRRIEAANKAASMDEKFDQIIGVLEQMVQRSQPKPLFEDLSTRPENPSPASIPEVAACGLDDPCDVEMEPIDRETRSQHLGVNYSSKSNNLIKSELIVAASCEEVEKSDLVVDDQVSFLLSSDPFLIEDAPKPKHTPYLILEWQKEVISEYFTINYSSDLSNNEVVMEVDETPELKISFPFSNLNPNSCSPSVCKNASEDWPSYLTMQTDFHSYNLLPKLKVRCVKPPAKPPDDIFTCDPKIDIVWFDVGTDIILYQESYNRMLKHMRRYIGSFCGGWILNDALVHFSLDLVLLSDSALVEIMPISKWTLMSAKTNMESFVVVFDYKAKHMTVNESEESILALINSENLCVKHGRQYASEYLLPVEVESSLPCRLQLWKGIKGVQRCRYVKLVDGNYVYDKGKSDMYDNEWYGVVVKENMKVKRDAVVYNSLLVALNKYELLSYSLPTQRPPSLPPKNDLKIDVYVLEDDVAELENSVDLVKMKTMVWSVAEFSYQDISIGLEESVKECRAFIIETMVQLGDVMMEYEALLSCYHMHLPMLLCEQFYKKRKIFVPLDLAHMNRKDPIRNEFLLLELDKVLENYSNFSIQRNVDNDNGNVLDETENLLGQVIGGLDKLVMNMKKGEVALVTIAPENAFGYVESQHDMIAVPSNKVLFYEEELGSFDKKQTSYDMNMKETIQVAGQDEDNVLFNVRKYARTSKRYEKAAEYMELNTFFVEEVKKKQVEKLCTKNLDVESTNVIAQYRRTQAYNNLGNLDVTEFETPFLISAIGLDDDAYLVRFTNNIFMFSVPRPPEEVEFDHEINLEAKEVKAMPLGQAYVANKILHLMNKCNQATLKCVEAANLEDKVFPKDGGMMRIGNLEGEVVF